VSEGVVVACGVVGGFRRPSLCDVQGEDEEKGNNCEGERELERGKERGREGGREGERGRGREGGKERRRERGRDSEGGRLY